MKVLIDNGHGVETQGKRSPDGRLREYAYTREIAKRVVNNLQNVNINAVCIVPEETDVKLEERVKRANDVYTEAKGQAILVSIHCNAMGNGSEWMPAHGWSVFVSGNASVKSKQLAIELAKAALDKRVNVRQPSAQALFWTSDLFICRKTNCPTVLVENFFQDNKEDVQFLLSEEGKQCVTKITVEGIMNYLKTI